MDINNLKFYGYYLGIGLGIILVVAFLTSQLVIPIFFSRAKSIEVPDVTKQELSKSKIILINNKLHYVVNDSTYSDEVKKGNVVSQKPEPGEYIKPDGTIYLVVSMGSRYVKVPELVGMKVQSAWIVLKNNCLRFSIADSVYSDLYSRNTVVQTTPDYGERVEKNSKIKLYISKGSNQYVDTLEVETDYNY
jgi:eukaryotic-like serine/threonine-protein kinase